MSNLALSVGLQRRLLMDLVGRHPMPWSVRAVNEYLHEVRDPQNRLVLSCLHETEAFEAIDASLVLVAEQARADRALDKTLEQERTIMTMPQTAADLFDKVLPAAFVAHPAKANEMGAIFQFKVTSSTGDGGEWTVDCVANPPTCARSTPASASKATCEITVTASDLLLIRRDPNLAVQLYFQGKLFVQGDTFQAMKLGALLGLVGAV